MKELLSPSERHRLVASEQIDLGKYRSRPRSVERDFVVAIDARPLASLINDAFHGHRLYEFMTIRRPGDILPYLWLTYERVDDEVITWVDRFDQDRSLWGADDRESVTSLPFVRFDRCFAWRGDDMYEFESLRRWHRETPYWADKQWELLDLVRSAQTRLRQQDDHLIAHELSLLDVSRHRRDFLHGIERSASISSPIPATSTVPQGVLRLISELIAGEDVKSVSCALDDFHLWRLLVSEQVRRSERLKMPPQEALRLSGPDEGLSSVEAEDWGGEIHIPYEGFCDAELLIPPAWRRLNPDQIGPDGRFCWAFRSSEARYVLTRQDHGELECAVRKAFGDWVLYQSPDEKGTID